MSPLDQARAYAKAGIFVFPCVPDGPRRKQPLVRHGCLEATRNEFQIELWWRRWPNALTGGHTGRISGFVVLDVDTKDPARYGPGTLDELGFAILPDTVISHTASGGFHLHFDPEGREIPCTRGTVGRGIGAGLDWRGEGGYVILPSEGSGYWWDPHHPFGSPLAPVPAGLLPRDPERPANAKPVKSEIGLSPYADAALSDARHKIIHAANGEQEAVLNGQCYSIGTLAGAGAIPEAFARAVLLHAALQIPNYEPRRPWRAAELERKVNAAFDRGLACPRGARHG